MINHSSPTDTTEMDLHRPFKSHTATEQGFSSKPQIEVTAFFNRLLSENVTGSLTKDQLNARQT